MAREAAPQRVGGGAAFSGLRDWGEGSTPALEPSPHGSMRQGKGIRKHSNKVCFQFQWDD